MKELRFVANSIATDDAYYLHFSDRQRDPTTYIVIQAGRHSNPSISVRAEHCNYSGIGGIETSLEANLIIFDLSPELASKIGGLTRVTAEFNVDRVKYEAICRQLWEILGYRPDGGAEAKQGHETRTVVSGAPSPLTTARVWPPLGKRTAMQLPNPIQSEESPRDILAADFKSLRGGLPIRGGWGYTQSDACIIDKNDPLVDTSLPFDGITVEYVFVEKRIYEEMIIFRPDGHKFSGIRWNLLKQNLVHESGKYFDRFIFEITAFPDGDWKELKEEFEGPQGYGTPGFNAEAHEKKRQEKTVRFTREFWFDITSFYGK